MKRAIAVLFWIFSGALLLMALALLSESALTSALLLGCAVLINPLFHEKIPLKKGLTALLAIGLFIAAVAVYPAEESAQAVQEAQPTIASREAPANEPAKVPITRNLQEIPAEKTEPEQTEAVTALPTEEPTPTQRPTNSPTLAPTATQTQNPTATPTQQPTPTPEPVTKAAPVTRNVTITILDYSDSVRRGAYAFIEIHGAPNTDYDCAVEYKSGMSTASGLGTKRSDSEGIVSWRWKVGSRTSLNYTPTIYVDGGGDSVSVSFDVTE